MVKLRERSGCVDSRGFTRIHADRCGLILLDAGSLGVAVSRELRAENRRRREDLECPPSNALAVPAR